jgi:hypothetical protein
MRYYIPLPRGLEQNPSNSAHWTIVKGVIFLKKMTLDVSVRSSPLDRAAVSKAEVSTYFKWTLIEWV